MERRPSTARRRPGPSRAFARPKPSTTSTSTRARASVVVVRPLPCPPPDQLGSSGGASRRSRAVLRGRSPRTAPLARRRGAERRPSTAAAGAIKGVREAEAIDDVDVDEATSVGRRRPTTLVPITQADVDDDKATNGGRRRPTTVTDAAGVDDDEVTSGGRRRPTTAMTVADVANVGDDEATTGGRHRPTANVNNDEAAIERRRRREAEAIDDVDVDEGTSFGRRHPITPVPPPPDQLGSSG